MEEPNRADHIDPNEVRSRLQSDFGEAEHPARLVADRLVRVAGEPRAQLQLWLRTGEIPDLEIEGFSLSDLVRTGMSKNPVSALIVLDDLLKDPRAAKRRLRRGKDQFVLPGSDYKGSG